MAKTTPTNSGHYTAFLDRGSAFEGTLSFDGTVRIDGKFTGDIVRGDSLIIGEHAIIQGTITVGEVILSGAFEGEIIASKRIVLTESAKVEGVLRAPVLGIEEGAGFTGTVDMATSPQAGEKRTDGDAMIESITKLAAR